MKLPADLQLSIPSPCAMPWAEMTTVAGTQRFCASCGKSVTDISAMTDAAIYQMAQEDRLHCVRASPSQLKRPVGIHTGKGDFYRMTIALGLVLVFGWTPAKAIHPEAPLAALQFSDRRQQAAPVDSPVIRGNVLDETGVPFEGVLVIAVQDNFKLVTFTDTAGSFTMHVGVLDRSKPVQLLLKNAGYDPYQTTIQIDPNHLVTTLPDFEMGSCVKVLGGMIAAPVREREQLPESPRVNTIDAVQLRRAGF